MSQSRNMCTRCVMDDTAEGIVFDEQGVCNFCTQFLASWEARPEDDISKLHDRLEQFVAQVKQNGKGKPYDCIVGVSGGVDSSWVLVQAVNLGLRPLAVHMDNGWNSELAQNNINNLVTTLGVDLHTHVINWQEYRALMQAFLDADVIDVEILYDNAMLAVNYQLAKKHKLKYMLSGCNQATEGMQMPKNWNWYKFDKKNIKAIAKKYSGMRLKTFPAIGVLQLSYYRFFKGIKWESILDMMPYNKFEVMRVLQEQYGYKPYPYKHYESIFTRFYQGYLLPNKFNVDKRKLHLSNLIMTGQMTREQVVAQLTDIPYPSEQALEEDIVYFLKKMGWQRKDLESYLNRPEKSHLAYPSEYPLYQFLHKIFVRLSR